MKLWLNDKNRKTMALVAGKKFVVLSIKMVLALEIVQMLISLLGLNFFEKF